METMYPVLLVAAVCCFVPGMSNVIRDGKDEEGPVNGPSCLQEAMNNENGQAAKSVAEFICTYVMFKDDKEKLIKEIQTLADVTGCSTEDIFGEKSPEQVAMDENGVLTQINIMRQLLERQRGVALGDLTVYCVLLDAMIQPIKGTAGHGNKRIARGLLGGGDGIGGILGSVTGLLGGGAGGGGGLLGPVTGLLGGGAGGGGGLLGPVTGLLGGGAGGGGGLLSPVTGLLGGSGGGLLGGLLGGQRSGGQQQGGLLGGLLGGQTNGACGQGNQGLGGLTGGVTNLLGGLLNGGQGGLLGGLLSLPTGLLGGLLNQQGGLLGGLLNGQTGLLQSLGGLTGGLTG